jgi:hypothetical protein
MKFLTQIYASLSAVIKAHWQAEADKTAVTALNAMVAVDQTRNRVNQGAKQDPTVAEGAAEAAPTAVVATGQTQAVKLTWVDSLGADDWCTYIYQSILTGFAPTIATLIAITPKGTQAYTATGLATGTTYYYRLAGCEKGGTIGTLAAEVSAAAA